jgi:hypothetical protein
MPSFQHGDGLGRQFASAGWRFQLHARILACLIVAGALPQTGGPRNQSLTISL